MSLLKVNKVSPQSGTDFTLGDSGDTFTVPSGATLTVAGTFTQTGAQTFDGGVDIDNFNINGTTITLSSGDMTLDVAGDIVLDADGGDVFVKDGGTTFGSLTNTSGNLIIKSGTTTAATFSGANVTLAGTVGSGNITSTGTLQGTTITATTAFVPDAANGATLGTASLEFADMYLHDGGIVYFGADQDVELAHVADVGLTLKTATTSDDTKATLTLQTGDTDIAANDVLGQLHFQAPDEGAGTDAILVAAGIAAISEGNFSASNNATKLSFQTGASEAASEKMSLSSAGHLAVSGNVDIKGGAIFNEDSADVDFRVESNGNQHMLFVDGGEDRVGVGIAAPAAQLTVGSNGSGGQGVTGKTALFSGTSTSVYNDGNNGTFGGITISNNDSTSNNTSVGVNLVHGTGGVASIQSTSAASATADLRFVVRGTQDSGNTVEAMKIDSVGTITKPFQPSFQVVPASNQTIEDTTEEVVIWGTERFDNGGNFASNVFTAPVTGKYAMNVIFYLRNIDTDMGLVSGTLLTSNKAYYFQLDANAYDATSTYKTQTINVIADMDASDTAQVKITTAGGTNLLVATDSYWAGMLIG